VRAPFSTLRLALVEAQRRLNRCSNNQVDPWLAVRQAAGGHQQGVLTAVNALLAVSVQSWQLAVQPEGRCRVYLQATGQTTSFELAAAQALALLIDAGGGSRLGQCAHTGCTAVFLDVTSGGNRRKCDPHQSRRHTGASNRPPPDLFVAAIRHSVGNLPDRRAAVSRSTTTQRTSTAFPPKVRADRGVPGRPSSSFARRASSVPVIDR
jgi:hypothetical protein